MLASHEVLHCVFICHRNFSLLSFGEEAEEDEEEVDKATQVSIHL